MSRKPFEKIFMQFACLLAERSTCSRLQVGAVIVSDDFRRVLAIGYNGNASGLDNACDSEEPGACGCVHAEENACINCIEPRSTPKVLFTTHAPCEMCAKRIINLGGVIRVYYGIPYRKVRGLELLEQSGIDVQRWNWEKEPKEEE